MPNTKVGFSTLQFKYTPFLQLPEKFKFKKDLVIELNLTPHMELGCGSEDIKSVVRQNRWKISILDGGWCDFFANDFETVSLRSINTQLKFAREVGVLRIRLFFGHPVGEVTKIDFLALRIKKLLKLNPDIFFLFETHDKWSCDPTNLSRVALEVDLPNFGYVIDPANIQKFSENKDFDSLSIENFVQHYHFKGLNKQKEYVSFAKNEVDLTSHMRYYNRISKFREVTLSVEIESDPKSSFDELSASEERLMSELFGE
jgi:hypothetical protein